MRAAVLILAVLAVCCAMASATPLLLGGGGGLFGGGRGGGLFGGGRGGGGWGGGWGGGGNSNGLFAAKRFLLNLVGLNRGKRSVREDLGAEQELVLSSLGQLDPSGCLLKLLCHLETKEEDALTRHETILSGMFRDATDEVTPAGAAFAYAVGIGSKTRDASACDKIFSKCPHKYSQLTAVLEESWACSSGQSLPN